MIIARVEQIAINRCLKSGEYILCHVIDIPLGARRVVTFDI